MPALPAQAELAERCSLLELKARMLEQSAGQLQYDEGLPSDEGVLYEDGLLAYDGGYGSQGDEYGSPPLSPAHGGGYGPDAEDAVALSHPHEQPQAAAQPRPQQEQHQHDKEVQH